MEHLETIYQICGKPIYGTVKGTCRITGKPSEGIPFNKWVKKTFNDFDSLYPGDIISNTAALCFDESSTLLQQKTARDKPQRFRTYSHIIHKGQWYALTKADKRQMYALISAGAEVVCLAETGQKHIFFKHKPGFWQLEDMHLLPDIPLFKSLHSAMCAMLGMGFSQAEVISGNYLSGRLLKADLRKWKSLERQVREHRGSPMFNFAAFMLFNPNS